MQTILLAVGAYDLIVPLSGAVICAITVIALYRLAFRNAPENPDDSVSPSNDTDAPEELLRRWLARTNFTISWADGTRRDWDLHLRPILAREFEGSFRVRAHGNRDQYQATGLALFGPELWEWVDASRVAPKTRTQDPAEQPGPGLPVLAEILTRLERS
ncbi:hypothetical protein IEU95_15620 [Hoyosella rhizosphaerae]|uniref:hypothetical protein n=1 Tax=Hoyosella rhizosphaerae TaxID=1755582 RepID=UPI00166456EA|nr:hypothetical protein [Hoyosella rhizosphaerae]MBN4928263.1 hypothetical protein [Hoyosella rhizosphaerae]